MKRRIEVFKDINGKCPYELWLLSLKNKLVAARIAYKVLLLSDENFKNYKSVGDGVFELRFFFGSGYRVYFGFDGTDIILLLCGGDKSTQSKDIEKAKENLKLYFRYKTEV